MTMNVTSRIRSYSETHPFMFPLLLLLSGLIGYGIFAFVCGFYWDDWPPVLLSNIHKAGAFWNAYGDRPYSAWTYAAMFPLLRNSAWAWQLANIILRTAGAYLFYLALVEVMPRQKPLFQWVALLSLFLPIFSFQYISVAFSQHFLTFAIYAASVYLLILSVKKTGYFWVFFTISLFFTTLHMFMMEYYVGLEVLKPIFLFMVLKQQGNSNKKAFGKTILLIIPIVLILGLYLYWRLVIFPVTQISDSTFSNNVFWIGELLKDPAGAIKHLVSMIVEDVRMIFVTSWVDRIWPADIQYSSKVLWLSLVIGAAVAGIFVVFFGQRKEGSPWISAKQFLGDQALGILIFMVGIFPVWMTLRQVSVGKYSDRFALAALPGIALLLVSLVWKIAAGGRMRNIVLSLILMISISYQIQIGNVFRKDYEKQQSFYAQLKWRMPSLKEGTALYSPGIIAGQEADYSLSMGLNLLYDTEIRDSLNYWFFTPRSYKVTDLVKDAKLELSGVIRGPEFTGVSGKMVSVYLPDEGCLLVLDPIYAQYPSGVDGFSSYGDLTNFDQIVDDDNETFAPAFGKIQNKQWCFYFEKADLARQQKDWAGVIATYEKAKSLGYSPIESVEYIPLIQALAETGEVDEALQVTHDAIAMSKTINAPACKLWLQLKQQNITVTDEQVSSVFNAAGCTSVQ